MEVARTHLVIAKQGEIHTRHDGNGDVEVKASQAVELLAHLAH